MTLDNTDESFYMDYKPKYKIFHELMSRRIRNVLLVSSIYDSFMLEEDGRLSDQIYEEFQNLNLRTLPRITRVSTAADALEYLKTRSYDLVITMRRLGEMDAFTFGKRVKEVQNIPVILLLNSVVEIEYLQEKEKSESIDRVFVWNGDSKVFVAIIKHLEDKMNVDFDTKNGQVKIFILVEDSIRFYSLILPELYGELMRQTHRLITEGTNDYQDLLKMRIRPKILLATNYEEAVKYYRKYKNYIMGVITDVEFPRNGKLDKQAGFSFIKMLNKLQHNLPVVLQSTNKDYCTEAVDLGCTFIYKRSHGMLWDLRKWLLERVGFGDFIFKLPSGEITGIARDIISFYKEINRVPIESLIYHGKNDHFSNWLSARGEFEIAQKLKPRKVSEFSPEELRNFLLLAINEVVLEKTRGIISDFNRDNYHPEILFLRLRPGSLGGKGRGLAFLMFLLNSFLIQDEFKKVEIEIPKTIVIGTAEFDSFMDVNNLYDLVFSGIKDEEIRNKFVKAKLSKTLVSDLEFILKDLKNPLAIRSSSLLEDSAYQPFAGIFSTYMIPNNSKNIKENLEQLCTAIKLVFASPFLQVARSYAETIGQTVEESKMAVVIQEVIGKEHNGRFYPDFSGTAASYNYYPFGEYMMPEDRIAHLALGLGKIIVDGGAVVRFCPKYPKLNFHATPDKLLGSSQKIFYAIDLSKKDFDVLEDDPFVQKYGLDAAIDDKALFQVADTYDFTNNALQIGFHGTGSPVITFNKQLKLETMPMAKLLSRILSIGEKAMGCSIEIEFAGSFGSTSKEVDKFYILQIRPFLHQESMLLNDDMESYEVSNLLIYSTQVSGNLYRKDICDIVYIKPDAFDKTKTLAMVQEINKINAQLKTENKKYILVGFGRWGTADRFLGIPVNWNNISNAKTIIEAGLEGFQIDFSQGSHFFHNIVTSNIGYMYIKYNSENHIIDLNWLKEQPVITDLEFVRHIRTNKPIIIRIDAKNREGMIIKPKEN
ncbi:MAG: hypothetical protein JXA54_13975 [Candidatus Heimdallarchaeota archaeon]|nr:hypothetical protein [Candidatus Heimdallarchaeota archaeon]